MYPSTFHSEMALGSLHEWKTLSSLCSTLVLASAARKSCLDRREKQQENQLNSSTCLCQCRVHLFLTLPSENNCVFSTPLAFGRRRKKHDTFSLAECFLTSPPHLVIFPKVKFYSKWFSLQINCLVLKANIEGLK